jgi:opacity protein-like surface antigen
MKNIIFVAGLALTLSTSVLAEAVVKEVCTPKVDKAGKAVMDKKSGKQAEDCKKIKTHKKVEGDAVPDKKK